nr:hypothetical protein BaRGS_019363 [Batillaria attramentaria]
MYWISQSRLRATLLAALLVVSLVYFLQSNTRNVPEASALHLRHVPAALAQLIANPDSGDNPDPDRDPNHDLKPDLDRDWEQLGTMAARSGSGWKSVSCNTSRPLQKVTLTTAIGNLTIYVYNSASEDLSVTARALRGEIFERGEITRFLEISRDLPLIDVGANVGLVALQAAIQGRQVVALEPVPDNAVRLCRAARDFGHAHLVHVLQNAISSSEGPVTLAMDTPRQSTHFTLEKNGRFSPTSSYAITLDRLLEIVNFKSAALKIDVEGHEGHVLAGAERLFHQMDIPLCNDQQVQALHLLSYGDFMRTGRQVRHLVETRIW